MRAQTGLALSLALSLVILFAAHSVFAAKASRIELKGGEVYEDVTFSVDEQYKVITIEKGDWKRPVSFTSIVRIIDENGQDVTGDYLGEYYEPPEPTRQSDWLSEQEVEQKGYKKRPFGFGARLGTNYSFPLGDYYDGIKSGIGYGLDVIIPVTKNVAIRGTASRSGMTDDLESTMPGVTVLDDNLSLSAWRYAISGQYYQWPNWRAGGKMLYYGFAGLGAITHKFSGTMTIRDPYSGEIMILYSTGKSQDKFILTYGGGIIAMVSKQIGIELGVTFDMVFVGTTSGTYYYGQAQNAYIFDLKAGVVALF